MKKMLSLRGAKGLVFVAAVLSLAMGAQAAVILEFDFQNHDAINQQVTASTVKAGASGTAQLLDSVGDTTGTYPTVNTGANTGLSTLAVVAAVKSGSMEVSDEVLGDDDQRSMHTSGSGSTYSAYAGTSFGSATIEFVYRPNAPLAGVRDTFFGHRIADTSRQIWFYRDGVNLALRVGNNYDTTLAAPTWDADTWYYVAASWNVNDEATIYWRRLTNSGGTLLDPDAAGTIGINAGTLTDGTPGISAIRIGARLNAWNTTGGENMDGELAYFRWTDEYQDSSGDYDTTFNSLVIPEPGSLGLVALAGAALLALRRRQRSAARN